jgi:type I restriction enzyme S subunit
MSPSHWKAYQETKNSGIEWLGRVPAHWSSRRLKHAVLLECEKALPDADTPYVGLENVESWTGRHVDTEAEIDGVGNVFRPGDVLFGKLRPYLAKALLAGESGQCSSEFLVLRPVALSGRFLVDLVRSRGFVDTVDAQTYGTKMPRADWDTVADMRVPLPPREEQDAIADLLDRETAKIDALVEKKGRLIGLLQEKRTALITHAVTKGLDPNVPMKDPGIEWLGQIPAHWQVKRLWHLTPSDRRIMYGIVLPGPNVEYGVPIVKGGDVSPERLRLDLLNRTAAEIEAGYVRSRLRGGDLVYAIRGSIGEVAIVPDELEGANLTQDAARVAYTPATYGPWLLYGLESVAVFAQLEAGALGATIRGVNIRDLKRASVPVPARVEQEAIADFLDRETARIDALTVKVREAIERLKEYRTALVSAAVTGKIDVRDL